MGSRDAFPVPTGVLQLLRLAALDAAFKEELLAKRAQVATAAGVPLTASEEAMLGAVRPAQLSRMIDSLPPPPSARLRFLRSAAASAVLLLGGAALADCGQDSPARPEHPEVQTVGGAAPDLPPVPAQKVAPQRQDARPAAGDAGAGGDAQPQPDAARKQSSTKKQGASSKQKRPLKLSLDKISLPEEDPTSALAGLSVDFPESQKAGGAIGDVRPLGKR